MFTKYPLPSSAFEDEDENRKECLRVKTIRTADEQEQGSSKRISSILNWDGAVEVAETEDPFWRGRGRGGWMEEERDGERQEKEMT
ncbi:uncharacterized protein MONOS_13305 [Monocercomonoides exilis]|uniref:uncharacterized protein n=1 Tax=Monocercomonoides exilis TaxID=2049356 RepID=UPI00355A7158|nr:hypothetical protein MONOS_13305 [Monocercomonoides exilis]|eukprot:MONOS_13305.1-p1 / transcript=MONOS_13305.1 / gene=MONOS_13305 / organism=Monocercomonoides_exilis_PA203 / gene_product=unspecified product / transcript_product=unspecified product / location=Mono_scaffold00806:13889-14146(-) / protein_length=86 / sequence_SO=supercontig / SO=protein_coding / is_pseudo=false